MATDAPEVALLYHEPSIVTILILTSFLLLLNVVNHAMDRVTYVGLLGQVFIGIAWGTPGAKWLGQEAETVVVNLGYLGLLLLVYEGGLTTSFNSLKANIWLSLFVAMTGIALPIGLSYFLMIFGNVTPLQAFAAGAALCSTSLGTTFTVMQTSGLNVTRMGVVLTSAAMMDDVVGLVMVQVIPNLGNGSFSAVTVIRPIFVSIAYAFAVPIACRFLILPLSMFLNDRRIRFPESMLSKLFLMQYIPLITHSTILVGMVAGASYAGTSNLFAADMTGAAISWWDSEIPHDISHVLDPRHSTSNKTSGDATIPPLTEQASVGSRDGQTLAAAPASTSQAWISTKSSQDATSSPPNRAAPNQSEQNHDSTSGVTIFETYYLQSLQRILKPFFFASIGFSIPITRMFTGSIIWRGLIYTILMFFAKFACGIWLIRMQTPGWLARLSRKKSETEKGSVPSRPLRTEDGPDNMDSTEAKSRLAPAQQQAGSATKIHPEASPSHQTSRPTKPVSLYPGAILGCSMVARGEIGFLISSLAEANGIYGEEANEPLYLIVTWAIMLCTIIGPICVGLMVKRLKGLSDGMKEKGWERRDALGVWGVS